MKPEHFEFVAVFGFVKVAAHVTRVNQGHCAAAHNFYRLVGLNDQGCVFINANTQKVRALSQGREQTAQAVAL